MTNEWLIMMPVSELNSPRDYMIESKKETKLLT